LDVEAELEDGTIECFDELELEDLDFFFLRKEGKAGGKVGERKSVVKGLIRELSMGWVEVDRS